MSAATALDAVRLAPKSRPVLDAPGLQVVPTPAPARGFIGTVIVCAVLILGAFGVAFHLNTLMVAGAYELRGINVEYNEVSAREATLMSEVIAVSSPENLREAATKLGMAPADRMLHLDIESGTITEPKV